ncbi:MAG: hypothetical protein RIS29_674 [Bacteroidota bacterium]|jgi:hypothetical protein
MKLSIYLIIAILVLSFTACDHKDETGTTSITGTNTISGKVSNYSSDKIDSIGAIDYAMLGSSKISTSSDFSLSLKLPQLRRIGTQPGITVSDSTALIGNVYICTFKYGKNSGELKRCNFISDSTFYVGMAYSSFIYCDRSITVKGTEITDKSNSIYTHKESLNYNFRLVKGWNELIIKVESYTNSSKSYVVVYSMTNTIPSNLKWYSFEDSYYGVKGKVKHKTSILYKAKLFE